MSHIVIIGTGHAGLTLAREVRLKDADCRITLLSKEVICAYYKPNLSKALSSGKTASQLVMKTADILSAELKADCISLVEVIDINVEKQECSYQSIEALKTSHKIITTLQYDKLVLAIGASPIKLPTSIVKTDKVLHINNLDDYRLFRDKLNGKKSVAIIGAGYIGCELASDLSSQGIKVSVIDRGSWPLSRAVPEALGSIIQESMTSQQDIAWYLGKTLDKIEEVNQKFLLSLSPEALLKVDLVISAIGLQANTGLAKQIGAKIGLAVQVDTFSQTSLKNIYALGDCAEYQEKLLPFITPITLAAKALAKTLTGDATELTLPANAVPVNISACPTVICPSSDSRGIWEVQGSGADLEAHFLNEFGELTGFALTGTATARKPELLQTCKGLFKYSDARYPGEQSELSKAS